MNTIAIPVCFSHPTSRFSNVLGKTFTRIQLGGPIYDEFKYE